MKSITHENRRRFTIITIVSVLVVAILTTTLVLLLNRDTTAPTNTIEVGKRIDTRLGGGRKLLNASVWDGSSATIWTKGSGTEADPYLIESAANLAYMRTRKNVGPTYSGVYFLQTVDIDLNNVLWSGITYFAGNYNGNGNVIANLYCNGSCYFQNSYKNYAPGLFMNTVGATIRNLTIENITMSTFGTSSAYGDAFCGALVAYGENTILENCKVDNFSATITNKNNSAYIGGMVGQLYSGSMLNCNVNNLTMDVTTSETTYVGGVVGLAGTDNSNTRNVNLSDINCIDMSLTTYGSDYSETMWTGGVVGYCFAGFNKSYASGMITSSRSSKGRPLYGMAGGIIGFSDTGHVSEDMISYVDITTDYQCAGGIIGHSYNGLTKSAYYGTITISSASIYYHGAGGLIYQLEVSSTSGSDELICNMSECLFDGKIIENDEAEYIGGIVTKSECDSHVTIYASNNLSQGEIIRNKLTSKGYLTVGLILDSNSEVSWVGTNNLGNCNLINNTSTASYFETLGFVTNDGTTDTTCNYGNLDKVTTVRYDPSVYTEDVSDDFIRDPASYASWVDFDTYWVINENLNNGYPMLRAFVTYAQVTGFDGSGTQANPYQIKTTADLQGMQAYYNDYDLIDEYYWILINDLNISTDANDLTINWCPIGYEGGVASGFNGYFDGNGKTISGLTITEQYENVGLFGRLSNNATITNLNVTGSINWDQATNVGGVVGLMEDGATITNCTFTGTITGYLNSGNHATIGGLAGKYSTDAITGSANYDCYVYGTDNYTTFSRYTTTYSIA